MMTTSETETELLSVVSSSAAIPTTSTILNRPEFLPLHAIDAMPRIATKNNILKLSWWHSPTTPQQDTHHHPIDKDLQPADLQDLTSVMNHQTVISSRKSTPLHKVLQQITTNDKSANSPALNRDLSQRMPCNSDEARPNDNDDEGDLTSQDSKLLVIDPLPCEGILNPDEEDEMKIYGYRRSRSRTFLCWLCIFATAGLLRLILHWWRHWYLLATHKPCPLLKAEKVLIQEEYQGKHKLYHVKTVRNLNSFDLWHSDKAGKGGKTNKEQTVGAPIRSLDDVTDGNFHLSVHFSSAEFKTCKSLRVIRCKQLIYAWDDQTNSFNKINGLDIGVPTSYFHQQRGLSMQERVARQLVYGPNEITVPHRDFKTLLFLEVLNPFYVFQIFSVILWFTYDYYYYACVIILMTVFSVAASIIQTKKNGDRLRESVHNTGTALIVNAKGDATEAPTQELVPGDIIEIPSSGCIMQCDAILLSGNCILDESMLTGESVPVTKTPLPMKRDIIFDKKEHARHTLFCGTKVIQTRYIGSKKVLAFVVNTGNITAKGGLIRSILYPPPVDYKFEKDSYKFIQCLALIAGFGFVYTLVSKILRGTAGIKIAVESLDLITVVVPPALPAAMTVGRLYAEKRLKRNNIYCISPRSINVSGSIDCCCFDKTGTLTEDGLDMWGVVPKSSTNQFQIPLKQIERLPFDNFLFGMVTCHSITIMNDQMMGDPLDLKMFESTGWILEDTKNIPENEKYGLIYPTILRQPKKDDFSPDVTKNSPPVQRQSSVDDLLANVGLLQGGINYDHGIVREFPFTSSLQRMSVITRCLSQPGFNVYCKGSPEMLQQLCRQESLPENYTQQLSVFAKKGYRIIAMAYKPLSKKMNYTKAQRLTREDIEHDLEFLGFVIMENRLKPDTTDVISTLTTANIRSIMVTGDNILTAMSVARDCGIVSSSQAVITVNATHKDDDDDDDEYELYYTLDLGSKSCTNTNPTLNGNGAAIVMNNKPPKSASINGEVMSLGSSTLQNSDSLTSVKTCDTWTHNIADADVELGSTFSSTATTPYPIQSTSHCNWRQNYRFAIDGKTWQIIRDHFPEQMKIFLTRGVIYARMSPEQKQALIMELQKLDYCVAMCGDGANDCGALKVAHTGISLSETESSMASPFTSRNPTIAAVPNVIKEGRAALVTSFGIFKYMAAYSLVQFISVMILYSIDSNLTDKQFLYIDLFMISIFAFFFGKTEAYAGPLNKQVPLSSLVSPTPLASLILHLLVVVVFQVAGWYQVHQQPWFVPFKHASEEHLGCYENYTIFAISSFQYIILAFVFSKAAPYRRPIWSNWPFCLTLVVNTLIIVYLVLYPSDWIADFFQLIVPPDMGFRYLMVIYGALNFVAHLCIETFVVEYLIFKKFQVRREQRMQTSKRKYMHVEYELQSYENWPPIAEEYEPHEASTNGETETNPTYVNLSAEQNLEIPKDGNVFPGFFELENGNSSSAAKSSLLPPLQGAN